MPVARNKANIELAITRLRKEADIFPLATKEDGAQRLYDAIREFMDEDVDLIVSHVISTRKGNVTFIIKNANDEYRVLRCFAMNEEWAISVDAEGNSDNVISKLVELKGRS